MAISATTLPLRTPSLNPTLWTSQVHRNRYSKDRKKGDRWTSWWKSVGGRTLSDLWMASLLMGSNGAVGELFIPIFDDRDFLRKWRMTSDWKIQGKRHLPQ